MYADDLVLASKSLAKLQAAFNKLMIWAEENEFTINKQKTVQMIFRKGGKIASHEKTYYKNEQETLRTVSSFKYLGITLLTSGTTYTRHIKDRVAAAVIAMNDISLLSKLSTKIAMELFHAKISPIITYGLEMIWEHLTKRNLQDIENVKAIYMKKMLCLSKFTPSRLCYELARELFYTEELRYRLMMPSTTPFNQLQAELQAKKMEIWDDFYSSDAMTTTEWMKTDYELRHIVTRVATHGFHHRICTIKVFHIPNTECMCELCGRECERYHGGRIDKQP